MDQQQWLNWRRGGIGSSDAAVIVGVSPWRTPYQIWEEKLFGICEQFENSAMTRGKELEETARRQFEELMGIVVFPKNMVNPDTDWLRASLDGMCLDEKVMVEIKCPNKEDHSRAVTKKVPEKYWPQCQHQLAVTGLPGMYYFSFDGSKGVVVEVARDQSYIDQLFQKEKEFWALVQNGTPPALTDRDKVSMEDNEEWLNVSEQWKNACGILKDLEEKEKSLRQKMIELSDGRSSQGNGVSLCKSFVKGAVDYSKVPQLSGVDVDQYRKNSFIKWTPRII